MLLLHGFAVLQLNVVSSLDLLLSILIVVVWLSIGHSIEFSALSCDNWIVSLILWLVLVCDFLSLYHSLHYSCRLILRIRSLASRRIWCPNNYYLVVVVVVSPYFLVISWVWSSLVRILRRILW